MSISIRPAAAAAAILLGLSINSAATPDETYLPDDAIVVERGGQAVTVGDLRAKVRLSLPQGKREGFFADGDRVARLVEDQLTTRQLAAEARKNGLDKDPQLQAEIESYIRGVLARQQINHHLKSVVLPDAQLLARERYLANKSDFVVPASRDVRHILILTQEHSDEEALALANKAYDRLKAGEDFDAVLDDMSEDPAISHKGWVRNVRKGGAYDADFTTTAFKLAKPGDFSEPVKTPFGYHVIVLVNETPEHQQTFDEAKPALINAITREQREAAREAYLERLKVLPVEFNEENLKRLPEVEA